MKPFLIFPYSNFIRRPIRLYHATVFHGVELAEDSLVHSSIVLPPVIQPNRHLALRASVLNALQLPTSVTRLPYVTERRVRISYDDEDNWGQLGWNEPDKVLLSLPSENNVIDPYVRLRGPKIRDISGQFDCEAISVDRGTPPFKEMAELPLCRQMLEMYPFISVPCGHIIHGDHCSALLNEVDPKFFVIRELRNIG